VRAARRTRHGEPRRQIEQIAGEAVDMETHDAADILAQVIAAIAAGLAGAAGERAVHHHRRARLERRDVCPDSDDLARGLGADHQWHLALGEGHAAPAPHVDVVECNRLAADLPLVGAGRRRLGRLDAFELAVGEKGERAHAPGHVGSRPSTSETFWPPKPNELESAWRTLASRATLGTTSSGIAGSGTW